MDTIHVKLTSRTPILQHADSIEWADLMDEWRTDPANRQLSKAGDDRTPPFRWIGSLYFDDPDDGVITLPIENIMATVKGGAAEVPTGRGKKTYKALSQSGLLCEAFHWPLLIKGKPIKMASIQEIKALKTFKEHAEAVKRLGFSLFVKRVAIGQGKHIRVRPMFRDWTTEGDILITDSAITPATVKTFFDIAGRIKGLCDWRPGSKSPGPWGMYTAEVS